MGAQCVSDYGSAVCIWPWLSISGLRKPNLRPSLSSPPVTTQGNPLELVVFRHVTFFYNPAECYNESHHDLKLLFWQKFLSKPSQTFCELIVNINNTFDSAKAEVLWLHTLDHDRDVWTNERSKLISNTTSSIKWIPGAPSGPKSRLSVRLKGKISRNHDLTLRPEPIRPYTGCCLHCLVSVKSLKSWAL